MDSFIRFLVPTVLAGVPYVIIIGILWRIFKNLK